MGTLSEVVDYTGIFPCKESNNFCCSICTVETICQNSQKHIESPRHLRTLQRFRLVFDKSSKGVVCKVCSAYLDWESLKTHAILHKVVPWYEPSDRYKIFFKNHILEWDSQLYCKPCDIFFPEWSTAYIHIGEKIHRELVKKLPSANDFAFCNETEVPYDTLVTEGFKSTPNSTSVECTVCLSPNIDIRNVLAHVKGQNHLRMKKEFMGEIRKVKELFGSLRLKQSTTSYSGDKKNAAKSCSQILPCIYIVKKNEHDFSCQICDVQFFSRASVDCHVKGTLHKTALIKYGCENIWLKDEDYIYHCTCCDCPVLGIKNVHQHVRGLRHNDSLLEMMRNSSKNRQLPTNNSIGVVEKSITQAKSSAVSDSSLYLSNKHIEKLNSGELLCRLCNVVIKSVRHIQVHLTAKNHLSGEQHLSEYILLKEGNNYHCKCCNCMVPGLENVYNHISGNRHAKSMSELESQGQKKSNNNSVEFENPKQSEKAASPRFDPNDDALLAKDHIEKLNSRELLCRLCVVVIKGVSNVQSHLAGKNHLFAVQQLSENILFKEGNNYHCRCCNCMIPGLENVYGHIHGNRHAKSLNDLENQQQETSNKNSVQVEIPKQPKTDANSYFVPNYTLLPNDHMEKRNSRESHCRLCNVAIVGDSNVQKHLMDKSHVFGVKQFTENILFKEGNNYHCKCCNCMIPGLENVYGHIHGNRHAKSLNDLENQQQETSNKNSVQVEIPKQPKTDANSYFVPNYTLLPNDHMEKRNSRESHCRLGDVAIVGDSNIQKHLMDKNHAFDVKQLPENITLNDDYNYHGRCYDSTIPGLENVYEHIMDNNNMKSLNDLKMSKQEASNKNCMEIVVPKQSQSTTKPPSVPNDVEFPKDHMEKRTNGELYCRLCNEAIIGDDNVQEHLTKETHILTKQQLSKNISFKQGNIYYCNCCDCPMPGVENVYRHIKGIRHAKSLNDLQKHEIMVDCKNLVEAESPNQMKKNSISTDENLSYDHIFKLTDITSCCKICQCKNLVSSSVGEHVAGKRHTESLKQFSKEISLIKNDKYQCKSCNWTIYGIGNVYMHLQGNRHKSIVNMAQRLRSAKRSDSLAELNFEIDEQMKLSMKLLQPKSGVPEFDVSTGDISCTVCGNLLQSTSELHSHLAIHVGMDLALSEKSGNINEIKDNSPEEQQKNENGITESELSTEIKSLEQIELVNYEAKTSSNCFQMNGETIHTKDKDFTSLKSPESNPVNSNTNLEKKRRSPRKSSMQKIIQLLNCDNDYIHDMRDKFRDTELGMKLCLIKQSKDIYCLICRKEVADTVQNFYTHLSSVDHCEFLDGMEKDHALFELVPGQFSEFDLVCQYMEEVSEDIVRCHACNKDIDNTDNNLRDHFNDKSHEQTCNKMHIKSKAYFEDIKSRLHCDWYDIHKYRCEPCNENFETELAFAKHLRSTGHAIVMRKSKNSERRLFYDFCSPCALLWFGFRSTYAKHSEDPTHKWVIWKELNESQNLPKTVENLLDGIELYIDITIKLLDELFVTDSKKEEILIRDLEMAVKLKFPDVKVFPFGSRVSGLRTGDSDFDIFLDCGNMYDGKQTSEYEILYFMTSVHQCLSKEMQYWKIDTLLTTCRSSTLKARHKVTGLTCEISFENGLAVENMKLIKYFTDIFPPCRKMILFLNQWLHLCDLAGSQGISNHALYWYVIFYLQKESLLPSVACLIASENNSHLIAGWEVGVLLHSIHNEAESSNLSVRDFLVKFFTFYAKFDYRYNVACPLLGQEVKKIAFANPQRLPKEMAPYVDYIKNSTDPRLFRIDTVMCIQDPLKLQINFTETVSKACLSRFRACCSKSLDVLCAI